MAEHKHYTANVAAATTLFVKMSRTRPNQFWIAELAVIQPDVIEMRCMLPARYLMLASDPHLIDARWQRMCGTVRERTG